MLNKTKIAAWKINALNMNSNLQINQNQTIFLEKYPIWSSKQPSPKQKSDPYIFIF